MQSRTSRKGRSSSRRQARERQKQIVRLTEKLLGSPAKMTHLPGGKSRKVVAVTLKNGQSAIATMRSRSFRAEREYKVLKALYAKDAAVPKALAYNRHRILVQEALSGVRLTQALNNASSKQVEALLTSALQSLSKCQQNGSMLGFDRTLPILGGSNTWIRKFIQRPEVIGEYLGRKPPKLDHEAIIRQLKIKRPRFIKWDARPGNAMVNENGQVFWFDWEHCGARNRLDDMAWLMFDEYTPDIPEVESKLIAHLLSDFADQKDLQQAKEYLAAYGVFHSVVRLGLILRWKKDKDWWDFNYCLDGEKVGVTLECATRLCKRASRWASYSPTTIALGPWFVKIAKKIEKL